MKHPVYELSRSSRKAPDTNGAWKPSELWFPQGFEGSKPTIIPQVQQMCYCQKVNGIDD
jgi:hypothetical protein